MALLEAGLGRLHPSFDPARVAGGAALAAAQDKARKARLRVWEKEVDAPPPPAEGAEGEDDEAGANGHSAGAEVGQGSMGGKGGGVW